MRDKMTSNTQTDRQTDREPDNLRKKDIKIYKIRSVMKSKNMILTWKYVHNSYNTH